MPVRFEILSHLGLVHVQYSGLMRLEETRTAFGDYAAHPDRVPGLKQLVDLRAVTGSELDFPTLLKLQAEKADLFYRPDMQTLIAYLADHPETQRVAQMVQRSWDGIDGVTACAFTAEADALSFLGLKPNALTSPAPQQRQ